MNTSHRSALSRHGFSLFEMLMVLSILGVMISLSVPMLFQTDSVYGVRNRRNAQELCSTSAVAQAAGLDFVQQDSVMDTIRALVRGGMPSRGTMKGRLFVVPGLSEEDMQGAAKYLVIKNGELRISSSEQASVPGDQRM